MSKKNRQKLNIDLIYFYTLIVKFEKNLEIYCSRKCADLSDKKKNPQNTIYKEKWQLEEQQLTARIVF